MLHGSRLRCKLCFDCLDEGHFRMIFEKFWSNVEKFKREMWEEKRGYLGKTLSNLCQGLVYDSETLYAHVFNHFHDDHKQKMASCNSLKI